MNEVIVPSPSAPKQGKTKIARPFELAEVSTNSRALSRESILIALAAILSGHHTKRHSTRREWAVPERWCLDEVLLG